MIPLIVGLVLLALTMALLVGTELMERRRADELRAAAAETPVFDIAELPENLDDGLSTAEIVKRVAPSVVNISIYMPGSATSIGAASGIVMTEDGFILTNAHVVSDGYDIAVRLTNEADSKEYSASVVGWYGPSDIAVIKITPDEPLTVPEFGNSNALQLGERVVTIGNAGDFPGTVTQGIVSGLNRSLAVDGGTDGEVPLIQVDAALSPGISGGALINRFGQIVGIPASKITIVSYEGIGFAIPISEVQPIVSQLMANGYAVGRPVLGVQVYALSPFDGEDLPSQGLYIDFVEPQSDLIAYDVTVGDIILEADGETMRTPDDLSEIISQKQVGDTIALKIQKGGSGRIIEIEAVLIDSSLTGS